MKATKEKPEFASAMYTAGDLNAVVKLLRQQAGPEAVEMLKAGELEVRSRIPKCSPTVWHKILLGRGVADPWEFCQLLKNSGFLPATWDVSKNSASLHLVANGISISSVTRSVDLVNVSVGELGFRRKTVSFDEIMQRAQSLGLDLLPAEAAYQLCLQFPERSGEFYDYALAMRPLRYKQEKRILHLVRSSHRISLVSWELRRRYPCGQRWIFGKRD